MQIIFATASELGQEMAQRLKMHRMKLGVSQQDLAQRAGVSLGTVSTFEKTGKATLDTFMRLIIALGLVTELEKLFTIPVLSISELEASLEPPRRRVRKKPQYKRTIGGSGP